MGNYTSMKAAIGLAPGNIENRSIEEPASRNEFCHDKEIITSSHLPVPAPVVEAGETEDEFVTMLITCFVVARLDYCNAMFTGLPRYKLDRLQAVQNAAVRLISGARKFDLVTPLLRERHWLPVEQRISFKMTVMTYKCVHGTTADYLADDIRPPTSATANLHLCSTSSGRLFVPRSKTSAGTDPLQLLVHVCGTVCLPLSHRQAPWPFSKNN